MANVKLGAVVDSGYHVAELVSTAKTLYKGDSGKVFYLESSGGAFSVTIDSSCLTPGWRAKFVAQEDTPTGDITIAAGDTIIYGNLSIESDTAESNRVACVGKSNVLFDTTCLKGDSLEINCDGTSLYVVGFSALPGQGGFTVS